MTSQISTHKLLRQEIRQNGWMFALTTLIHFLAGPVTFLLGTADYHLWNEANAGYRFSNFFFDAYFIMQIFVMIICITLCIVIYRYLFSRRMVDLYHSVPISRGQLFWVKYLHGFLLWFVPFIINAVCIFLLCCFRLHKQDFLASTLFSFAKAILFVLLCFFIFYHLFLTAVYLSGNVLNMFLNVAAMGCCAYFLWLMFYACADYFFDTYCYNITQVQTDIIFSLSPFLAPFAIYGNISSLSFSNHMLLPVLSAVISALYLLLAHRLCMKRPSELAERGTLAKGYTPTVRIFASILLGLAGSIFFCEVSNSSEELAWSIFGVLLCSIVSFGAINSIFNATIKAFFKHKFQLVAVVFVSTLIILTFHFDLLGYDTYIPDKEDIAGIAIFNYSLSDDSYDLNMDENSSITYTSKYTSDTSYVRQKDLITNQELCYQMLNDFLYLDNYADKGSTSYYVKVQLTNGYSYERRYTLPDVYYEKLAAFIEAEEYKSANYKYSCGIFGYPDYLEVSLWDYSIVTKTNEEIIREVMDAYWQDFEAHYNIKDLGSYLRIGELSGYYYMEDGSNRHFSLYIPEFYENTIAVLEKLHPEYMPFAQTASDIKELTIYADGSYNYETQEEFTLEDLYEYFGYTESSQVQEITSEETMVPSDIQIVNVESTSLAAYSYMELTITDIETLEELFPFLYFGSYYDLYDLDEYIRIGNVVGKNNASVNVYAKPGTLPKEIIEVLYNNRRDY